MSNTDGYYQLDVPDRKEYLMQYSFLGYQTLYQALLQNWKGRKLKLEDVSLSKATVNLDEVTINAERIPVQMRGDTIVYDANAFKTREGDDVEQLLELMPGLKLDKDGNLIANGVKVEKVLVNGKEFFGSDPKTVTKNLDAKMIDKVAVLDRKSREAEATGVDDGEEQKTIDLTLKEEYNKGKFGKANGALGTEETYEGKINFNAFNEKNQVSVIASANNLNDRQFTWEEYQDFSGQTGRYNGNIINGLANGNQGISDNMTSGLNWTSEFNKDLKTSFYYTYQQAYTKLNRTVNAENFTNNRSFSTQSVSRRRDRSERHAANTEIEWEVDSFTKVNVRGNVSLTDQINRNNSETFYSPSRQGQNLVSNILKNSSDVLSTNWDMDIFRKFRKKSRSLWTSASIYWQDEDEFNEVRSSTFGDSLDQFQDFNERMLRTRLSSRYTEPINDKWLVSLRYNGEWETNTPSRSFFDRSQEVLIINDSLTGTFERNVAKNKGTLYFQRNTEKTNFRLGASVENIHLETNVNQRDFNFFYPYAWYRYKITRSKSVSFSYRASSNVPSLNQLIAIPDNTNPNSNYIGNPALKPEYTHQLRTFYRHYDRATSTFYYASVEYNVTQDKIVNQRFINNNLITIIQPTNSGYYESFRIYTNLGGEIKRWKLDYELSPYSNFTYSDEFINGTISQVDRVEYGIDFGLGLDNKKRWDFGVGFDLRYNTAEFAANSDFNQNFNTYNWEIEAEYEISERLLFEANYTIQQFAQASFSDARLLHLVNASFRYYLKDNPWYFYVKGYDLLKENIGLFRTNEINSLREENFNTRTQFVMLGAGLKFGKRKEADKGRGGKRYRR